MENKRYFTYPGLRFSKDKTSILVTLDAGRAKKNGLFPVRVQVVCARIPRFYPTGKDLSIEEFIELPQTKSKRL